MKYIVYEFIKETNPFSIRGDYYVRHEVRNDNALKDFLFRHRDNLSNIEIFNTSGKCKIDFNIVIGGK